MKQVVIHDFDDWRTTARRLITSNIQPHGIVWESERQRSLFDETLPLADQHKQITVPKAFMTLAKTVACFRSEEKWGLLYQVLWRIVHGERHVLQLCTDNDVIRLRTMARGVRRDIHKMQAFVRFRQITNEENCFMAWYQPTHLIVAAAAPFFVRRFAPMKWSIVTPDASAHWNSETLRFDQGLPRRCAPSTDDMEVLWKTYYRHIFNPTRINVKAMKSEMPVKYWHALPEAQAIPTLLQTANHPCKTFSR
jgi:DNA polymerase